MRDGVYIFPADGSPPRLGLYRMQLVRGGPWVGAALVRDCPWVSPSSQAAPDDWCRPTDRPRGLVWVLNGQEAPVPSSGWPVTAMPIGAAEYDYLTALADWSRKHAPYEPHARPREAVDLSKVEVPF